MVNRMEWEKHHNHQQLQQQELLQQKRDGLQSVNVNGNCAGMMMCVKVMTDEQLETLRKQIAVYAVICERLVELHKQFIAQQDFAGARLGNMYCDPLIASVGHKITSRQRWTPTPVQLQILERIFDQGIGTPNKLKIKEITAELSQHGQISETNVYNWFQNRRARSKRKQQNVGPSNAESEVETEGESIKDKKTKPEEFQSQNSGNSRTEDLCLQNSEVSSELHYLTPQSDGLNSIFSSDGSLKSARGYNQMSAFEGMLSNSRGDYITGKMEMPTSYGLYPQAGDYNMTG
ncbi:hypothetical protein L6164_012165 [Bauhinia variegata]|uniref:Uncharacterized protein n=1 Tax=Bauhinia variegata TaxID=167791 RepID=A0ACB9P8B5_BAUVA|nr:hypothetical protein L6164_012165 [Bauhinia variegata]